MKYLKTKTLSGLLVLGSLLITLPAGAQPSPMDFSKGKHARLDSNVRQMPAPQGPGFRSNPHEGPNPGRILGNLFRRYDLDENGELAGIELGNAALDMVVRRLPGPGGKPGQELDLKAEAESLEARLVRDFDMDESGGISPREMLIALEALRPRSRKINTGEE